MSVMAQNQSTREDTIKMPNKVASIILKSNVKIIKALIRYQDLSLNGFRIKWLVSGDIDQPLDLKSTMII